MEVKKRKVGRPSKYTPDFLDNLAKKLIDYVEFEEIPFLKDFCFKNKFGSQRIAEFAKMSPIFSEALNRFKDCFEAKLVIGSISGKLQGYMTMNTLKNCCGWRDKQADIVIENHTHLTNIKIKELNTKPEQDLISLALGRGC